MKKIVLSLASVLAATAFAPEAAAVASFARQTGMACSACHQQHFPVLNSFGRAFKAGGYTMMGAQGKVEGDHLSIPDTLNLSMLLKLRYQDQGGSPTATQNLGDGLGVTSSNGQWQFGDELVMFGGGRVAENVGFFTEITLAKNPTSANAAIFRMPFAFDVGSVKLSIVPFTGDASGVTTGYDLGSTGTLRANRWSEQRSDISAFQYSLSSGAGGYGGAATGFAFVAQNDMGYINYTRWSPNYMIGANSAAAGNSGATDMNSNLFRFAITPSYNDWAFHLGGGFMTGVSELSGGGLTTVANSAMYDARAHFFDGQAHGKLGGKDIGFYATYAKAPKVGGTCGTTTLTAGIQKTSGCNLFNGNALDKWSWTLGADYSIIPHTLHIGAAYRDGRTGQETVAGNGQAKTAKSTMVQAIYDFTQNVALHAIYSSRSGSVYLPTSSGQNETLLMLEAAW